MWSCIIFSFSITDPKFPMGGDYYCCTKENMFSLVSCCGKIMSWYFLNFFCGTIFHDTSVNSFVLQTSKHFFDAPWFPNSLHSELYILHHNDQLSTAFSYISRTKKDLCRSHLPHKGAKHPPTSLPRPGVTSDQIKWDLCN